MRKHIILATAILALSTPSWAKRISEYDAVDAFADADKILLSDTSASGREKTVTGSAFKTYIGSGVSVVLGSLSDLRIDIGPTEENLVSAIPTDKTLQTYTATQIDTLLSLVETAPTIQSGDPTSADANGWYLSTTSGDMFYLSSDGMFTIAGTYSAWDTSPAAFTFTDETGIALSTAKVSDTKTLSGIDRTAPISVSGDAGAGYKVGASSCTSTTGTISNGDTFNACVTSSSAYETATAATVTIGGVSDTYTVTTMAEPVASCSSTPYINQTSYTGALHLGSSSTYTYLGIVNKSATALDLCRMDIYVQEYGSLTGGTVYVQRWTVDSGTNDLLVKQQDITSFDPTEAGSSVALYTVAFGQTVSLPQNQAIVFTMSGAGDASNYFRIAYTGSDLLSDQYFDNWDSTLHNTSIARDLAYKGYKAP